MTFLQPSLLWLLPLAALPVVIHLLNRMRFRTVHWAAMSFLFSANRASTRHARLRQLLLLACRVLALLALILAVARPLAGGWAGWMLSSAPDAVLILLDRSASMETQDARTGVSRRQKALESIAASAAAYGDRTRFVLLENVQRTPEEIANVSLLPRLPGTGPTDTAADLPAMLDAATTWLSRNRTGVAEIWIASDLQRSNWQPQSPRWAALSARLAALPGTVRVRLLDVSGESAPNASVTLVSAGRRPRSDPPMLDLVFDIRRSDPAPAALPVSVTLDGVRCHLDLAVEGSATRVHRSLALDPSHDSGYGSIELPPDANLRDNTAWFVYGPAPQLRVALVGPENTSRRYLQFAADPFANDPKLTCDVLDQPGANAEWDRYACVFWDAPLPAGAMAAQLAGYVKAGGAIAFFPPGAADDAGSFAGAAWGDALSAPAGQPFRIMQWDRQDGPLADSGGGGALAVDSVQVARARAIVSGGEVLAALGNNRPVLTERVLGSGRVWFCGTLPDPQWSSLGDGRVLVPMLQRMLQQGAKRFAAGSFGETGDASFAETASDWTALAPPAPRLDIRSQAGIYRNGARLVAVNRPAEEDEPDRIDPNTARRLFAPLQVQLFQERGPDAQRLQGEIWRALLFAMLIFLIGEGYLSLPSARPAAAAVPRPPNRPAREPELASAGRA